MKCWADRRLRVHRGRRLPSLIAVWLFLVGAPELEAQTRSIRFERLSVEGGLSQSTVNCILQDRTGFIWLGTQDGLNRYDGYGFEVYEHDPDDPASLAGNWIEALVEDAAGDLWIGTDGTGLARWRRATDSFAHFRHHRQDPESLSGDRVVSIQIDRRGDLWLGTAESGLNRLDPEGGRFERFRHDPADPASLGHDYVKTLYEDRAGNLWAGTWGGLDRVATDRFDASARSFVHHRHDPGDPSSLSDDRVLSILEDHAGRLWVGTMGGLNRWDPQSGGFVRFLHDPADAESLGQNRIRVVLEDDAFRLWVATDGGLDLLRAASGRFAHYRNQTADPSSLSNDRVMSIFQDRGGVLWVGTQGGGVNKWHPATWDFSHFKVDPAGTGGLSSNAVYGFSEDHDGKIWIATHGGVNVLDRSAGRFDQIRHDPEDPSSLSDDRVGAVLHDRAGTLWVATLAGGLNRLDPGQRSFRHYRHQSDRPESLGSDAVSSLFEDLQWILWVGTFGGGLHRLDREADSFVRFRHDPEDPASLSADRVNAFADDGGFLWVGTFDGGLNRLDRQTGAFLRFRHDPERPTSLSNDTVYVLHVDDSGDLWAGTQGGLNRLASKGGEEVAFRRYLERDGLANDVIVGIQPDSAGRLWLSTNGGLARFDPQRETFKSYTASHGLQSNEFNFGAHFGTPSGELFFGGVNGFNAFFPERIEPDAVPPPVVLTSFSRIGRPMDFDRPISSVEHINLSYRDYFFSFELAALDYAAPAENRYRYKLEGFDSDWIEIGHRRRVTFTNLDPGDYTLRVQGANNDGVWNRAGASVRLTIRPPFWQTWWFRAVCLLAFAGILWRVHQRQLARAARRQHQRAEAERAAERERLIGQLETKNADLERFAYTVSHDLKAPLVTIKGFLRLMRRDAAADDDQRVERNIERIDAAADKMRALVEELLQLSRVGHQVNPPEEVPFGDLAREAVELVAGQITERRAEVRIEPDLPVVSGDRARLVEVLQNLIQNAVKYMGEEPHPRVEIGVWRGGLPQHGGERVFYVRDNGIGIEPRHREKVFELFQRLSVEIEGTGVGLALVQRIVELHGGRIWVESDGLGQGSTFCFTLGDQPV